MLSFLLRDILDEILNFIESVSEGFPTYSSTRSQTTSDSNSFKVYLNKDKRQVPTYYYTGNRSAQILHTGLRSNCSSLNVYLFTKNVIDLPLCRCGSIANVQHYFFFIVSFIR